MDLKLLTFFKGLILVIIGRLKVVSQLSCTGRKEDKLN